MTTLARRERGTFADMLDWLEAEFPAFPGFRPFSGAQMIRVEEFDEAGQYVLRAELPGIDPDKDVDIAIEEGLLTVKVERHEEKKEGGRSEFRYGTFTRTLRLPTGAAEDDVRATYHDGILEIRVPIAEASKPTAKHISIVKG
ncbi:HSP20 family molecular chaperone IbpA [Kribbella orskensis]|uniref:HSP20 family molecular chaperone IbpA n=1 Tax=Kribbella orskensis TaxID=2512216 RepID=A0ABY2BAN5_9ACTN|nr:MULTISPECIES: Hsp20/alpha crystallin family protein [Kribbella]TCN31188.1 HSP20 family molecular chaperone IbpA [Kribbella sp. VKM Ac-2500]TCO11694.1 HSP20 family molecular chaperone IbpA [Kribbella orskensis]